MAVSMMEFHVTAGNIFHESGREGLVEWINDSDSPEMRGLRKNAAFIYLYGNERTKHDIPAS